MPAAPPCQFHDFPGKMEFILSRSGGLHSIACKKRMQEI